MAKRGENIHKRKDGRWEGRYIKSRTPDGKACWGYIYGQSYAAVKQALLYKKAEVGFYRLSSSGLTFFELAENWLHSVKPGIKESTYAHYHYTLHKYLLPMLGDFSVESLNEELMEHALEAIITATGTKHQPLGHSSAKECLSMLRRICKYAVHLHLMRPVEIRVALPQEKPQTTKPLTPAEQNQLCAYILANPSPRKVGILLGIESGLRIGEICGLKWSDFDLNSGTVQINRTVIRISCGNGHTKVVIQTPKTRTSHREIPLSKHILVVLRKLHSAFPSNAWFLSGNDQKPVEPRCYRKSLKAYLRQASVHLVRPHTLRHTFATTCLQARCDIKTLSELLGHSNPSITLKRYVHSDLKLKRQEINRIFART